MRTDKPVKMRIGYRNYTLRFVKSLDGGRHLGEHVEVPLNVENYRGIIRVVKGLEKKEKANTILHEILHAIWYVQGIGMKPKEEERTVSALANGLIAFMRDNPRLVLAMLKMAREEE